MAVICIVCMIGRQSIRATLVDICDNKIIRTNIKLKYVNDKIQNPATFTFSLPTHVTPSPENPVRHVQWKDPLVLVQLALG